MLRRGDATDHCLCVLRMLDCMFFLVGFFSCETMAAPIPAPDLRRCHFAGLLPVGVSPFKCCAPVWNKSAIDFQLHHSRQSSILRVRKPAHSIDEEYALKLNRAYKLMKSLPPEDPRSFIQQANIHCAYCNMGYSQGNTSKLIQIHGSWLFFSFHRWYMYFHERILAKLLGDNTFSLPFWNYDHPNGSTIPEIYMQHADLYDPLREFTHLPPAVVKIDYDYFNISVSRAELLAANARAMYHSVVSGARTPYLFFGMPYRLGDDPMPGYGTIEMMPHNSVHDWTGDINQVDHKDMGSLFASGRDPVFYAHHGSIDRLWEVWKSIDGHRDIDDPDYLDTEFVFYNEDAELMKVKVRDSLSTRDLGYIYEDVEDVWLDAQPSPITRGSQILKISADTKMCEMGEVLEEPCSAVVRRQKRPSITKGGSEWEEEILVVEGITTAMNGSAAFDVFLNLLPESRACRMHNCTEYVGTFLKLPQITPPGGSAASVALVERMQTSLRVGLSYAIKELHLEEDEELVVTVVPMSSNNNRSHNNNNNSSSSGGSISSGRHAVVAISDIKIEYDLKEVATLVVA